METGRFSPGIGHTGRMKKRPLVLKIIAAFLADGGIVWLIARFSEPVYQGIPLSVWLDEAYRNGDVTSYLADTQPDTSSARAVRAIGADALPTLINMVRTKDTPIRRMLDHLSTTYKWLPMYHRLYFESHPMAVYGFRMLGPSAKSAVPDLVALLDDNDPQVRVCAACCLAKVGRAGAVPGLEKHLRTVVRNKPGTGWEEDAEAAIYALGGIGPAARPALSQIAAFTNSGSYMFAATSRAALIKITGSGLAAAVKPLEDPSNLTNWYIAWAVVEDLGSMATPLFLCFSRI